MAAGNRGLGLPHDPGRYLVYGLPLAFAGHLELEHRQRNAPSAWQRPPRGFWPVRRRPRLHRVLSTKILCLNSGPGYRFSLGRRGGDYRMLHRIITLAAIPIIPASRVLIRP